MGQPGRSRGLRITWSQKTSLTGGILGVAVGPPHPSRSHADSLSFSNSRAAPPPPIQERCCARSDLSPSAPQMPTLPLSLEGPGVWVLPTHALRGDRVPSNWGVRDLLSETSSSQTLQREILVRRLLEQLTILFWVLPLCREPRTAFGKGRDPSTLQFASPDWEPQDCHLPSVVFKMVKQYNAY